MTERDETTSDAQRDGPAGADGVANDGAPTGARVYGNARSARGEKHGVSGSTDAGDGAGLYTPDDARVEGDVDAGSVGRDRVMDTSGRYLGELTGTDDASTIADALADRTSGAGLVVPDPGFDLHWDRMVELPNENGFRLETRGMPTLAIPSGYGDPHVLHHPPREGDLDTHEYPVEDGYLGSFAVDAWDVDTAIGHAVHLEDVRHWYLEPWVVAGTESGLRLGAPNAFANQNVVMHWEIHPDGGTGITLAHDGASADQNWLYGPHVSEARAYEKKGDLSVTAYRDQGKHNNWLFTRAEFVHTVHEFDGTGDQGAGKNYYVSEGGWDRTPVFTHTVVERGDAHGHVDHVFNDGNFAKARILSPNTRLQGTADPASGGAPRSRWVDIFERLRALTKAMGLAPAGLQDVSTNGGETVIANAWTTAPVVRFQTGESSGSVAAVDTGGGAFKPDAYPKALFTLRSNADADERDVLVRTGFYGDDDNRAELVFDPTGALGTASNEWQFQVVGGTELVSTPVGAGPTGGRQMLAVTRERGPDPRDGETTTRPKEPDRWFACVGRDPATETTVDVQGSTLGAFDWHASVKTLTGTGKSWNWAPTYGAALWRL